MKHLNERFTATHKYPLMLSIYSFSDASMEGRRGRRMLNQASSSRRLCQYLRRGTESPCDRRLVSIWGKLCRRYSPNKSQRRDTRYRTSSLRSIHALGLQFLERDELPTSFLAFGGTVCIPRSQGDCAVWATSSENVAVRVFPLMECKRCHWGIHRRHRSVGKIEHSDRSSVDSM